MNLTNAQYNEIMREYSRRQNASHRLQEQRREQIYREIPQMHELDALAGSLGLKDAVQFHGQVPGSGPVPPSDEDHHQGKNAPSDRERIPGGLP